MIVHRDLEVCTFQVGRARAVYTEALTTSPGNLQDVQEGWQGNDTGEILTGTSLRVVDAGAVTARFASKLRTRKAERLAEWNISLVGAPVLPSDPNLYVPCGC